jgi:hypothetical protein
LEVDTRRHEELNVGFQAGQVCLARCGRIPAVADTDVVSGSVCSYIIRRWVTRAGFGDAGIRFGPLRAYLAVYVAVTLVFIAVYF